MKTITAIVLSLSLGLLHTTPAFGQDFRKWEAQKIRYKQWLDSVGPSGTRFWIKLDARHRPHRLYVGGAFFRASYGDKERFVEIYSHYLAGHPEKFMLIDIFDVATKKQVGEFGWGGFKLNCGVNGTKWKC